MFLQTGRKNDILWLIAGDGNDRTVIEKTIEKEKVEDKVILLGSQDNPYCFMSRADLVVLVSYHEAAPMVYLEAQYLGTHVFTTQLASSVEMLDSSKSIICENSEEGIGKSFKWLSENIEAVKSMKTETLENEKNLMDEKIALFDKLLIAENN